MLAVNENVNRLLSKIKPDTIFFLNHLITIYVQGQRTFRPNTSE